MNAQIEQELDKGVPVDQICIRVFVGCGIFASPLANCGHRHKEVQNMQVGVTQKGQLAQDAAIDERWMQLRGELNQIFLDRGAGSFIGG